MRRAFNSTMPKRRVNLYLCRARVLHRWGAPPRTQSVVPSISDVIPVWRKRPMTVCAVALWSSALVSPHFFNHTHGSVLKVCTYVANCVQALHKPCRVLRLSQLVPVMPRLYGPEHFEEGSTYQFGIDTALHMRQPVSFT